MTSVLPPGAVEVPPFGWSVKVINCQPLGTTTVIERGRAEIETTSAKPGVTPLGLGIVSAPGLPSMGSASLRPLVVPATVMAAQAAVANSQPASTNESQRKRSGQVRRPAMVNREGVAQVPAEMPVKVAVALPEVWVMVQATSTALLAVPVPMASVAML